MTVQGLRSLITFEGCQVNRRDRSLRVALHSEWNPKIRLILQIHLERAAEVERLARMFSKVMRAEPPQPEYRLYYFIDRSHTEYIQGDLDRLADLVHLYLGPIQDDREAIRFLVSGPDKNEIEMCSCQLQLSRLVDEDPNDKAVLSEMLDHADSPEFVLNKLAELHETPEQLVHIY